jgi:hypothetical protein
MRKYNGREEVVRSGCCRVIPTPIISISVLMEEKGKCRLLCWRLMDKKR